MPPEFRWHVKANVMDGKWFEQEVSALLPNLYATALHFARNAADAEDLVADAIAKAWAALPTLHDASRFRCWILRILTNTYLMQYRARDAPARGAVAG